ncbi:isocitrate/isopropylmalate dehydrogenase family protein [[Clostridium] aminophilum]|uniref:isocitrate/isopropylmalate dehydrogenase family protein n=1 Tax=[Clostridium] aminophilum TaxID=1526 RepID=UPI00332A2CF3
MDKHTVTVFRGDGIGPELVEAAMKVLDCAGAPLSYEVFDVGEAEYERNGKLIPDEALASFERTRVMLKSPITTPVGKGFRSLNVTLRGKYNLYANIRPVKSIPAIETPFKNVDIVIFRENTEGLYAGVEDVISEDEVHALKIVTRPACENIIRAAFDYAVKNGRKKVTCVHKANIIKRADGMFLSIFRDIAKEYPDIEADDKIIDNTCMQLVMRPEQFDIMVMQNLYGDILSDLCSGLVGGLGVVPSSNMGADHAMFEAVHGSAPDIAGQRIANPTAFIWSACLMLDHLGEKDCADRIRNAIDQVLNEGKHLTRDLHGNAGMDEYVDAICEKL